MKLTEYLNQTQPVLQKTGSVELQANEIHKLRSYRRDDGERIYLIQINSPNLLQFVYSVFSNNGGTLHTLNENARFKGFSCFSISKEEFKKVLEKFQLN